MSNLIPPQAVGQNIARAKSLLRREEPLRALDALIAGLEAYTPATLLGKARFETEVLIEECIVELNRQSKIKELIKTLSQSATCSISYTPGKEDQLKQLLPILRKGLIRMEESKAQAEEDQVRQRKISLEHRALEYLRNGDPTRAKATLRTLAEEFGQEEGVLFQIGTWLMKAELYYEAAEFLEQSIETFPRDSRAYAAATSSYIALHEYEKAEAVYQKALKEFGRHTKTLTNMAKLYAAWNKKEQAFEAASAAYKLDNTNTEAKEIMEKYA